MSCILAGDHCFQCRLYGAGQLVEPSSSHCRAQQGYRCFLHHGTEHCSSENHPSDTAGSCRNSYIFCRTVAALDIHSTWEAYMHADRHGKGKHRTRVNRLTTSDASVTRGRKDTSKRPRASRWMIGWVDASNKMNDT